MARRRTIMSWSSGKDSAHALARLRGSSEHELVGLLTTLNAAADRVAMHGVRRELLEQQARALGLPLTIIELPYPCSNEVYEAKMRAFVERARGDGVEVIGFGDLALADIRAYRERQLAGTGLEPVFPLWASDTHALAREMIEAGVVAHLTCVDPRAVPASFAGRRFDAALLAELPEGVDPCGENGEFHSFVSDAPGFAAPIEVRVGEVVERDGFVYADLLAAK